MSKLRSSRYKINKFRTGHSKLGVDLHELVHSYLGSAFHVSMKPKIRSFVLNANMII